MKNEIEERIKWFVNQPVPDEHKELARKIKKKGEEIGFQMKPMGSRAKNTMIEGSDIDFLVIMETKINPRKSLNNLMIEMKSLNPYVRNHSIVIKDDGYSVDLVPGITTNRPDYYEIPDFKKDRWIARGQDDFIHNFNQMNEQMKRKLVNTVKILKLWKQRKSNLDMSSLAIEKICYDAFKSDIPASLSNEKAVIRGFKELREQIGKKINHPSGGQNLNKLNDKKEHWKKVVNRDIDILEDGTLDTWVKVLGPRFDQKGHQATKKGPRRKTETSFG